MSIELVKSAQTAQAKQPTHELLAIAVNGLFCAIQIPVRLSPFPAQGLNKPVNAASSMLLRTDPLSHPLAMACAGLALVLGVKFLPLGWFLAVPLAAVVAFVVAGRRREATLPDLIKRSLQLAGGADAVAEEAGQRLLQAHEMGRLTAIQLCCQRVRELPATLEQLHADDHAGQSSSLLSASHLEQRLRQERKRLGRDSGSAVGRQRERLIQQLERNLNLARQGRQAGSLRVMAVSEHLESVAGDLQAMQVNLRQPVLPALPDHPVDAFEAQSDPRQDPMTVELATELDELDQLLRDALGKS